MDQTCRTLCLLDVNRCHFQLPADLIPDEEGKRLAIRCHGIANRRNNTALEYLFEIANEQEICYPGTDLPMVFDTG